MEKADLEMILNRVINEDPDTPSRVIALSAEDLDRSLDELEVDSLAKAEMIAILDDQYEVDISDAEAAKFATPRDILDFVTTRAEQGAR
ncbi:MAG: acyl carrier protein [Actinophytocola sp.]|uniref:phosphopantetheine-binding protein n=1 Tax=Actinophytocola sp. TaxID=1872138 RepID=UPI003C7255C9